ncbi:UrcA family protein [Parvularcula dongshanensis]|uniref:UrcA family protein n=1 Tax=Parvularcula dongshanensis TaxID=1173995 RepID=A0A840I137_9PROT|nr:UrcA family protein [Parvularcula dongshanensis]MBB4657993.1 UrcA family protein [Parvularcula dongshanensis]
MKKIYLPALAAIATLSATAYAGDVTVSVHSGDLASERGVAETYAKIERTAEAACGTKRRTSLRQHAAAERCREELVEEIVSGFDHPVLTAWHAGAERPRLALAD